MAERFVPFTHDHDSAEFFASLRRGELIYRRCEECYSAIHPPTAHCPHCGSWQTGWQRSDGRGTVYAYSVVHHQIHPAYPTPYTLVLVELDDASPPVRLVGYLAGEAEMAVGQAARVRFEDVDGTVIPQWDLVAPKGA